MSLNFNVLSAQINSLTNDNETLFVSGKGDNAKLGSAGTFGRMFRSASSFVEGAKAFLDGIAQKYGDGIRQMAWSMAMNSHVDGKFGLTVGTAKDILAKCEMLANARDDLKAGLDPTAAGVCTRVLLDKLSELHADAEKAIGEVRVLASLLKGSNLSPEEGAALGKALKGVTIPSDGAVTMIVLARQPDHPLRTATPPGKLPLLFGLCRQLTDCQAPTKASELGDATFNDKNDVVKNVAGDLVNGRVGMILAKALPKLDQLERLAPHGMPTKAMIVKVLLTDDPNLEPYVSKEDVSEMDSARFRSYLGNSIAIHSDYQAIISDGSRLPLAPANAENLLEGTIFPYEKMYVNEENASAFTSAVGANLKFPELIAQFQKGACPPITSEIWAEDPATDVSGAVLQTSNYGFASEKVTIDKLVNQGVSDLCRVKANEDLHLSLSVSAGGSTQSAPIGTEVTDGKSIESLIGDALSHCQSGKQKLMLASALTQNGTMTLRRLGLFLAAGRTDSDLAMTFDEHMSRNVDVQFRKDGSVTVSYQFPKELEATFGKLELAYNIDKDGNIKTEQFRYELSAAFQQGQQVRA